MRTNLLLALLLAVLLAVSACSDSDSDESSDADSDGSAKVESSSNVDQDADDAADEDSADSQADDSDDTEASDDSDSDSTDADDGAADDASGQGASDDQEAAPLGNAVALVNGQEVALADFQRQAFETQRFYVERGLDANTEEGQQQLLYLRKQVLDDMLNQVLIEQAAAELGIQASDAEVDERVQAYVAEFGGEDALVESLELEGSSLDDIAAMERSAIVGQKLLDHIAGDVPDTATFVHARHILCETHEECDAALGRLNAGETFDAVAKDVSIDETSAARGGDLEWIARGMLPSAELEDQIFGFQPGQRSGVVETDYGFHVIEVLERDEAREMSAEQRYTLREKLLMEWLEERRAQADIEIFVEDLRELATVKE